MAAATGIAAQGISAAIVNTAINKITKMITDADNSMVNNLDDEVNAVLRDLPRRPKVLDVSYSEAFGKVNSALSDANLDGANANVSPLPLFLDGVIGSFFDDYLGKMDYLFPGLSVAGADTQAFVSAALNAAMGVSYNELVDSTPGETAFLKTQREVYAKEREALGAAATAGHRFAHGHMLEAMARMRGDSISNATDAILRSHAQRVQQEREEKTRLARASIDTSMDRIKRLHQQVAENIKLKLQARGMWVNDQNAVMDAANNIYATNAQFDSRVTGLLRQVATRRFNMKLDEAAARDREDFLGKLKMANANEVVDLFGNAVTTLMNQVSARGTYSGTERDVTDWDSILA